MKRRNYRLANLWLLDYVLVHTSDITKLATKVKILKKTLDDRRHRLERYTKIGQILYGAENTRNTDAFSAKHFSKMKVLST